MSLFPGSTPLSSMLMEDKPTEMIFPGLECVPRILSAARSFTDSCVWDVVHAISYFPHSLLLLLTVCSWFFFPVLGLSVLDNLI